MYKTKKRYQDDVYQKECPVTLLSVIAGREEILTLGAKDAPNSALLLFDQTIFFPEGGGQPCDLGVLTDSASGESLAAIIYVFESEGVVYHQAVNADLSVFHAGQTVTCRIDWERRFSNMQRHCGEHILSAVFYDLYGGVNRGFHMGEHYMTIDISLEEQPQFTVLTDEQMLAAEREANQMIRANLPVSVRHFEKREEAEGLPMRKRRLQSIATLLLSASVTRRRHPAVSPAAERIRAPRRRSVCSSSINGKTIKECSALPSMRGKKLWIVSVKGKRSLKRSAAAIRRITKLCLKRSPLPNRKTRTPSRSFIC